MSFGLPQPTYVPEDGTGLSGSDLAAVPDIITTTLPLIDTGIGGVVGTIEDTIGKTLAQCDTCVADAVGKIATSIDDGFSKVDKTLNRLTNLFEQQITAILMQISVNLSTAITQIATALQISTNEVIYGPPQTLPPGRPFPPGTQPAYPYPGQPQPPVYPPGTSPGVPTAPGFPPGFPPYPPGVGITQPPPNVPTQPPPQPSPISIVVGGVTVGALQVCPSISLDNDVIVGGNNYKPTFTVVNNPNFAATFVAGGSVASVSYDPQPDGSLAIHIGPVSVVVTMPPADRNPNAPSCPLAPNLP